MQDLKHHQIKDFLKFFLEKITLPPININDPLLSNRIDYFGLEVDVAKKIDRGLRLYFIQGNDIENDEFSQIMTSAINSVCDDSNNSNKIISSAAIFDTQGIPKNIVAASLQGALLRLSEAYIPPLVDNQAESFAFAHAIVLRKLSHQSEELAARNFDRLMADGVGIIRDAYKNEYGDSLPQEIAKPLRTHLGSLVFRQLVTGDASVLSEEDLELSKTILAEVLIPYFRQDRTKNLVNRTENAMENRIREVLKSVERE